MKATRVTRLREFAKKEKFSSRLSLKKSSPWPPHTERHIKTILKLREEMPLKVRAFLKTLFNSSFLPTSTRETPSLTTRELMIDGWALTKAATKLIWLKITSSSTLESSWATLMNWEEHLKVNQLRTLLIGVPASINPSSRPNLLLRLRNLAAKIKASNDRFRI